MAIPDEETDGGKDSATVSWRVEKQKSPMKSLAQRTLLGCGLVAIGVTVGVALVAYLLFTQFLSFNAAPSHETNQPRAGSTTSNEKARPTSTANKTLTDDDNANLGPTGNLPQNMPAERRADKHVATSKPKPKHENLHKKCNYFNSPFTDKEEELVALFSGLDSDPTQGKVGGVIVFYDVDEGACRKANASAWTMSVEEDGGLLWNHNNHPDTYHADITNRWYSHMQKFVGKEVIIDLGSGKIRRIPSER